MKNAALCNCIVLYDYSPGQCDLKGWFEYMEKWAEDIGIPWESGSNLTGKLILFRNAKRKYEKMDFISIESLSILGGVSEPGTHLDWKSYANFSREDKDELFLCFPEKSQLFNKENLKKVLDNLLSFGDFKYGICYQRPYNMGPADYAGGALGGIDLPREEESKIGSWNRKYTLNPHYYRTGLLRDVYPFNIFVQTHLNEKVGDQTLEQWIRSNSRHGTLDKLTDNHWLWSIVPEDIAAAQEILQEAGLLLCYKP